MSDGWFRSNPGLPGQGPFDRRCWQPAFRELGVTQFGQKILGRLAVGWVLGQAAPDQGPEIGRAVIKIRSAVYHAIDQRSRGPWCRTARDPWRRT